MSVRDIIFGAVSCTPPTGRIWSWGCNVRGQLGDNTVLSRLSPVSVVGGFTDWCQISGASQSSFAVRQNGTVWAWGQNTNGLLGDNCTVSRSSPVSVVGGFTDWCQVSGGQIHALAVRQNGTAWGWGANSYGRIGDNCTVTRSSPVSVAGGFTDWCRVSAGPHSFGIRQNGTLWAWGQNLQGRLGDNTTTNRSSPVSVVGGFTDWCQVQAGRYHSLALRQNGTVWGWGCNAQGQIGDDTVVSKSSPVSVVGGFTDWCYIAAETSSMGVRQGGSAWAWGTNGFGQLGDNTIVSRSSPVSVVGINNWCTVQGSTNFAAGIRQDGTAWAWGNGGFGKLGDNTTTNKSSPVSVVGGFTTWCQISLGAAHALGICQG